MPGDDQYDQDGPSPETNFTTMYHDLSECFGMALTAKPSSKSRSSKPGHGCSIDPTSFERLKKKLHEAYNNIDELSVRASRHSGDTQALITEAELVLTYLDKSRDLWDPRGEKDPSDSRDFQDHEGPGPDGGDPDSYQEGEPGK